MDSLSFSPQLAPPPPPPLSPPSSSTSPSKTYNLYDECSLGLCTFNCPQWCILPPPPPLFLNSTDDDAGSSSSSRISPLMAALIAVLAAAFLLLFYFTVISKLCRRRRNRNRNNSNNNSNSPFLDTSGPLSARVDSLVHDPTRPGTGLDEAYIRQITVFNYRREDRLIDGTECAVCLNEFNEGESLRLMPNCEHAFHIPCIDTWLQSHSNCPLCRSTMNPVPPPPPPPTTTAATGGGGGGGGGDVAALRVEPSRNDVVLVIREVDNRVQVEDGLAQGGEIEIGCENLDERESKLETHNNDNSNNIR